ncbi:hypothetical protein JTB14_000440 [Gonioctena quinquepunctata]|nr:hypothetical protein JTB14_000440 [Gonioctena quinquepunctata]
MAKSVALMLVSCPSLRESQKNESCTFLTDQLTSLGYRVEKVLLVGEGEKVVTDELSTLAKQCDVVIVIGDSKSDTARKALANVCRGELDKLPNQPNGSYQLPPAAKCLTKGNIHPVMYTQRIFILRDDSIEEQFRGILKKHLEHYRSQTNFKKVIHLQKNGNTCCVLKKLDKSVSVQSEDLRDLLKVTISGENFESIVECEKLLKEELGSNFVESYEENDLLESIYESEDVHLQQAIKNIEKCFETYGPENTFLSFNGGKDCTVLLHLAYIVLKIKYPDYKKPLFCLYVRSKEAFSDQDKFISQCQIFYNLDLTSITLGMKEALEQVLNRKPNLRACFMGTRKTDPYSAELSVFQMTDPGWPQIMRVSPLLEWHYSDIWDYLLYYKVPYCKLYDMGYTSLGNSSNTIRNPSLSYYNVELGADSYLPAYKMLNESKERSGRNVQL